MVVAINVPANLALMPGASPGVTLTPKMNLTLTVTGMAKEVNQALKAGERGLSKTISITIHGMPPAMNEKIDKISVGHLTGRAVLKISA